MTTAYDGANRPLTVAGTLGTAAKTYVSGINYAPGNQLFPNFSYNNRLQISSWQTLLYGDPAEDYISGVLDWGTPNNRTLRGVTETNDWPSYPAHVVFNQSFRKRDGRNLAVMADSKMAIAHSVSRLPETDRFSNSGRGG